jgi:excisionase family DNA binding protein
MDAEALGLLRRIDSTLARIAESVAAIEIVEEQRSYSKREAARILGCSVRTIERRLSAGELTAVLTGQKVRVGGRSLKRMIGVATAQKSVCVVRL